MAPILRVVARAVSGQGEVGDLVGLEAVLGQDGVGEAEELPLGLLRQLAQPATTAHDGERRARLDGEQVAGEVLRGEGGGGFELAAPAIRPLPGQAVDQVDRDGLDAGGHRRLDRRACLGGGVPPAEQGEAVAVEGLHPEAQEADTDAAPCVEPLRSDVLRVRFEA